MYSWVVADVYSVWVTSNSDSSIWSQSMSEPSSTSMPGTTASSSGDLSGDSSDSTAGESSNPGSGTTRPLSSSSFSQGRAKSLRSGGSVIQTSRSSCSLLARSVSILSIRSEEHTSELQSRENLVCRLLLEKKNINNRVH